MCRFWMSSRGYDGVELLGTLNVSKAADNATTAIELRRHIESTVCSEAELARFAVAVDVAAAEIRASCDDGNGGNSVGRFRRPGVVERLIKYLAAVPSPEESCETNESSGQPPPPPPI